MSVTPFSSLRIAAAWSETGVLPSVVALAKKYLAELESTALVISA